MSSSSFDPGYKQFTPHTIEDRTYWNALKINPSHASTLENIQKGIEDVPVRMELPSASDYLAARTQNDRHVLDRHWQGSRRTLSCLTVNRCLLGMDPKDSDDRLLNWLWALATESTWTVSAHLPEKDLPAFGERTMDLAACMMAAQMAETREILKPWMDSISGTLADRVACEVESRVLIPYGEGREVWWQSDKKRSSNWLGVCAGSILAACESLAQQGRPAEAARKRALEGLSRFVQESFTEHGECDEGIGYWNYGFGTACLGWSRLSKADAEAHLNVKRFCRVADYPRRTHLFANRFFSGNDGGLQCNAQQGFIPWLAEATGCDWMREWSRAHPGDPGLLGFLLRSFDQDSVSKPQDSMARNVGTFSDTMGKTSIFLEDQQVAILRAPAKGGTLLAALTGGHNAERHNHNDLGHFLIFHGDKLIVPDMGKQVYTADFFTEKRYTYLSTSSRGHCCPEIGEYEQRAGEEAAAKVLAWEPDAEIPRLVLDCTAAYPEEAGLKGWTRTLECLPASEKEGRPVQMVITDVYRTSEPKQRISHVVWSTTQPINIDERLEFGGMRFKLETLVCDLSPSPLVIGKDQYDPKEINLSNYAEKELYRMKAVYQTDEDGKLQVTTTFFSP